MTQQIIRSNLGEPFYQLILISEAGLLDNRHKHNLRHVHSEWFEIFNILIKIQNRKTNFTVH